MSGPFDVMADSIIAKLLEVPGAMDDAVKWKIIRKIIWFMVD